jgi:hypothetical protein
VQNWLSQQEVWTFFLYQMTAVHDGQMAAVEADQGEAEDLADHIELMYHEATFPGLGGEKAVPPSLDRERHRPESGKYRSAVLHLATVARMDQLNAIRQIA